MPEPGEPDQGRRPQADGVARREQRRSGPVERDRAAGVEDEAAVHAADDLGRVFRAEDRRPGSGEPVEQVGDRRRARGIELGGRLVEDEDVGPHRDDAGDRHALLLPARQRERLAVGEMGDRQPVQHGIDAAVHLGAGHAQVLQAERQLLADGELGCRELVGRCREHDPDPPEQPVRRGGLRVAVADHHRAAERRAHDPRDEPRRGQCQRGLAGARPAGHADPLARADRHGHAGQARLAPDRIADLQVLDAQRRGPGRGVGHRHAPRTVPTMIATIPAISARRSQRSSGGSATTR